jgi:uncharacterized protein YjbI with pentapeptide repeats
MTKAKLFSAFSPRLFVSYSRRDSEYASSLANVLRERGFRVFLDTTNIDPGENFVNRLSHELRRSTAVVAIISGHYSESRWAQAELYYGVARHKMTIPVVLPPASLKALDPPLERLLRDTQFVTLDPQSADSGQSASFSDLLRRARKRRLLQIAGRTLLTGLPALFIALMAWWVVAHLNERELAARRDHVIGEVTQASGVLQAPRITATAASVAGDRQLTGELLLIANDPARTDVARFNALALSGEMLRGLRVWRWYVKGLDLNNVAVQGATLSEASFLGGNWQNVRFQDLTFSGVFWVNKPRFGMSNVVFDKARFYGGALEAASAVNVSFINSKFRGTTIDTTSFAKVRFVTESPPEKGTPTITPEYTLFEHSTLISHRAPPEPNVMDLSEPEDDFVFEGAVFVDCRLEGWFKPEWFKNSSFERCVLPPSLSKEALERQGNNVE